MNQTQWWICKHYWVYFYLSQTNFYLVPKNDILFTPIEEISVKPLWMTRSTLIWTSAGSSHGLYLHALNPHYPNWLLKLLESRHDSLFFPNSRWKVENTGLPQVNQTQWWFNVHRWKLVNLSHSNFKQITCWYINYKNISTCNLELLFRIT